MEGGGCRGGLRSHTGAIVGRYETYRAAFRKAGVIEAETFEGFVDAAKAFAWSEPAGGGRRILVVTNGGGLGVAAADALLGAGTDTAAADRSAGKAFQGGLPPFYTVANPFDLTGKHVRRGLQPRHRSPPFERGIRRRPSSSRSRA